MNYDFDFDDPNDDGLRYLRFRDICLLLACAILVLGVVLMTLAVVNGFQTARHPIVNAQNGYRRFLEHKNRLRAIEDEVDPDTFSPGMLVAAGVVFLIILPILLVMGTASMVWEKSGYVLSIPRARTLEDQ